MNFTYRMSLLLSIVFLGLVAVPPNEALKHSFAVKRDSRTFVAPIGAPFGFTQGGCFGLDVFDFGLSKSTRRRKSGLAEKSLDQVEAGLVLKRFTSESDFANYHEEIMTNRSSCIFDPFRYIEEEELFEYDDDDIGEVADILSAGTDGIYIPLKRHDTANTSSLMYTFQEGEEGLYFLMYQVCAKDGKPLYTRIQSTFELDFHYRNYDYWGNANYLPAGESQLPHVFLYFSISYCILLCLWASNIRRIHSGIYGGPNERPVVYPIHQLMTVLLILKTLSVFFESVRYHYIRVSGHAELWSAVYYTFAFLKGTFLFTVILLIGSGWSFVKPFLSAREKQVILLVLILQVLDNIALVVLSHESEGERAYEDWSAVLHLVDIVCCCAVLVPIVWQVNALEKSLEGADSTTDASSSTMEERRTLSKLKLFRSFYLTVVAYIYFTRILIYLFATMLDYRHTWIRYFIAELITLLFYVVTGMRFRPMKENPFLSTEDRESMKPINEPEHEIEFGVVQDESNSKGS